MKVSGDGRILVPCRNGICTAGPPSCWTHAVSIAADAINVSHVACCTIWASKVEEYGACAWYTCGRTELGLSLLLLPLRSLPSSRAGDKRGTGS